MVGKKQEMVRVDSDQIIYLKYCSELTGVPITGFVRKAIEDWLDVNYSSTVYSIEQEAGVPSTTTANDSEKAANKAYDNMVQNLKTLQERRTRKFQVKA